MLTIDIEHVFYIYDAHLVDSAAAIVTIFRLD